MLSSLVTSTNMDLKPLLIACHSVYKSTFVGQLISYFTSPTSHAHVSPYCAFSFIKRRA